MLIKPYVRCTHQHTRSSEQHDGDKDSMRQGKVCFDVQASEVGHLLSQIHARVKVEGDPEITALVVFYVYYLYDQQ